MNAAYLNDKVFLRELDAQHIKTYYVQIQILDYRELCVDTLEAQLTSGSINVNSSSSLRRTCNLTFVLRNQEDYEERNLKNLFSTNKRIKIYLGLENTLKEEYPDYKNFDTVWFPQGVYLIKTCSITHNFNSLQISLSCQDKMCLLNGTIGGKLPASVTFDTYQQYIDNGDFTTIKNPIYDIIMTAVNNYGGIPLEKIFINDVDIRSKSIVHYTGSDTLYYNVENKYYTTIEPDSLDGYYTYNYNDNCGYKYEDVVSPGSIISNIGDSVTSVLDNIIKSYSNYEYFFDEDGNFVFQEIKNYLNNSYVPAIDKTTKKTTRLEEQKNYSNDDTSITIEGNNIDIIDPDNFYIDSSLNTAAVYEFDSNKMPLVVSYSNNLNYENIKNDFHIWGMNNKSIHYHLAIKRKPEKNNLYSVVYKRDDDDELLGTIRLANKKDIKDVAKVTNGVLEAKGVDETGKAIEWKVNESTIDLNNTPYTRYVAKKQMLCIGNGDVDWAYEPADWRAELYLQGLTKNSNGLRPDIYQQELLDKFDIIYDFYEKKFKNGEIDSPSKLKYWFDYLEPNAATEDFSVDALGTRIHSISNDKIDKLYNSNIPDVVILNVSDTNYVSLKKECEDNGDIYSNVTPVTDSTFAVGLSGYAAADQARTLLYQYTNYAESINLTTIPIFHLEVNTRISVNDPLTNISGDYMIKTISYSLGQGSMTISASKCVDRI